MQISLFIHIHTLCPQNNYDYEGRICYIFCTAQIHVWEDAYYSTVHFIQLYRNVISVWFPVCLELLSVIIGTDLVSSSLNVLIELKYTFIKHSLF